MQNLARSRQTATRSRAGRWPLRRCVPGRRTARRFAAGILCGAAAIAATAVFPIGGTSAPRTLRDTGLYSNPETLEVDAWHLAFSPQYPLWTDGAAKRRWISLPPGTAIDGSDPEAWVFPVGTRIWKEFTFAGRRVETRYIERLGDGEWLFAAYEWSEDGRGAVLAPERGRRGAYPLGNGRAHTIPGTSDCRVCHEGGASTVIGFSALQLSPARDPGAVHAETPPDGAVDLDDLLERGLLAGHPEELRAEPPMIAATDPEERAALGYLHGNCGHCHNEAGPLKNLNLNLSHTSDAPVEPALASTVGRGLEESLRGLGEDVRLRVDPGRPERSALLQRAASRNPILQMPPLGTEVVDHDAVALIERWIATMEMKRGGVPAVY